ncbi:MAG: hypothetical protein C5B50_22320 [Verrucomicrobia bacterium]|nr:MAG: hypothetical protein C5B50_22320 [Verrucomicrobiota bacterium]
MEIRIHTQSGSVERFFQDDPVLVKAMLKSIHSTKVFATNLITIAGDYSLTTFVVSNVNRVDLVTGDFASWKYPGGILDVIEVSEGEFRERSHLDNPVLLEPRRSPKQTGEFAVVFVEVEMTGGSRIFLAAKIMIGLPAERLQLLRGLFSAAAIHFRMPEGGTAILNLKNLVRFTLNPGPDVTPIDAWPAHHLTRRQESVDLAEALARKDSKL